MRLRSGLLFITTLILLNAPLHSQDSNNKNWKISWQAKHGKIENIFRSYAMKCGSDIDQDGKGEILLNDGETTRFSLLEAVANDSFALVWQIERPHQSALRSLAVTDWDLDGLQEVSVIIDSPLGEMPGAVYEWTGVDNGLPAGDAPTTDFDLPRNSGGAVCVEASSILTQLDGDPGPEWILPYFRGSGISMVILELSTGSFEGYGWDFDLLDESPGQVRTVEAGDLDNDGAMEIVAMDREGRKLRIVKNMGIDTYQTINTIPSDKVSSTYSCNAVESLRMLNLDGGMPELYLLDDGGRMYVMKHQGDLSTLDQLTFSKILDISDISTARGLAVGDLDRDGKPDLYFGNTKANRGVIIYDLEFEGGDVASPNSYKLYEVWRHDFAFGGTLEVGNIRIGDQLGGVQDLDGDGLKELVIAFGTTQKDLPAILVLENTSEATHVAENPVRTLPGSFHLQQNFPNPFNPTTEISYEIPRSGHVRLEIISPLGQCVAVPVDEVQTGGSHIARYDASSLPAGLYFYRLTVDGFSLQKKMLLVK